MNKDHLIPAMVKEVGIKLQLEDLHPNERFQLESRLIAIVEFCNQSLEKSKQKSFQRNRR